MVKFIIRSNKTILISAGSTSLIINTLNRKLSIVLVQVYFQLLSHAIGRRYLTAKTLQRY